MESLCPLARYFTTSPCSKIWKESKLQFMVSKGNIPIPSIIFWLDITHSPHSKYFCLFAWVFEGNLNLWREPEIQRAKGLSPPFPLHLYIEQNNTRLNDLDLFKTCYDNWRTCTKDNKDCFGHDPPAPRWRLLKPPGTKKISFVLHWHQSDKQVLLLIIF